MSDTIDARGLSCPQPVLLTVSRMKEKASGEIEVILDNEVSRENVSRAARTQGWQIRDEHRKGDDYHLILTR
jgi:tRNA 2-thiouridine synthesizing protein A